MSMESALERIADALVNAANALEKVAESASGTTAAKPENEEKPQRRSRKPKAAPEPETPDPEEPEDEISEDDLRNEVREALRLFRKVPENGVTEARAILDKFGQASVTKADVAVLPDLLKAFLKK